MRVELRLVDRQFAKTQPSGRATRVHEGLGVEKVGIHQRRKQHAHPQRPSQRVGAASARDRPAHRTQIKASWQRQQCGCRDLRGSQCFGVFALAGLRRSAQQARVQTCRPVGQTRVVAGNHIGQHACQAAGLGSMDLLKQAQRMQRTGGRVGFFAALRQSAFDMSVGCLPDIALKARPELAQVMPQPGQLGKFCAPALGEVLSPCRHCAQVLRQVVGGRFRRLGRRAVGPEGF